MPRVRRVRQADLREAGLGQRRASLPAMPASGVGGASHRGAGWGAGEQTWYVYEFEHAGRHTHGLAHVFITLVWGGDLQTRAGNRGKSTSAPAHACSG